MGPDTTHDTITIEEPPAPGPRRQPEPPP